MVFSLFEYLDSANCNHREYVQLWQIFDKTAVTFDLAEIERKKKISGRHEILLRIQSCHQECQNRKKKIFLQNRYF